jgi:hypothetical protein
MPEIADSSYEVKRLENPIPKPQVKQLAMGGGRIGSSLNFQLFSYLFELLLEVPVNHQALVRNEDL